MKKFVRIICFTLSLIMIFAFAGCGTETPLGEMEKIYRLAVDNGFSGSYEEWLASIIGPKGDKGDTGLSAYEIWLAEGHTGTEADFLAWLKGDPGNNGSNGKSAYEIWLAEGHTGTEADFLAWLKGAAGNNGTNGLSAYEIYLKYHPEYDDRGEEQWMDDLVNGRLADKEKEYDMAKFFNNETIVVITKSVIALEPRLFTIENFDAVNAISLKWVNKTDCENAYASSIANDIAYYDSQILAINLRDRGEQKVNEAIEILENMDFTYLVWRNKYDYSSNPVPMDEKLILEIDINSNFADDVILVTIDGAFTHRLFTVEDFKTVNAVRAGSLTIGTYYKYNTTGLPASHRSIYEVKIGNKGKQNVINAIKELQKLDFVRYAGPSYVRSMF